MIPSKSAAPRHATVVVVAAVAVGWILALAALVLKLLLIPFPWLPSAVWITGMGLALVAAGYATVVRVVVGSPFHLALAGSLSVAFFSASHFYFGGDATFVTFSIGLVIAGGLLAASGAALAHRRGVARVPRVSSALWPQVSRVRRTIAVAALLVTVLAMVEYTWRAFRMESLVDVATRSDAVRWWRCRGVHRPLLATTRDHWSVTYSWAGPEGPGRVSVRVDGDGHAVVRSRAHGEPKASVSEVHLSDTQVATLAAAVDDSGVMCQLPQPRDGYRLWDIGRYELRIDAPGMSQAVHVDECNTLPDSDALFEVVRVLHSFKGTLGARVAWGPYGMASVRGACSGADAASTELAGSW